MKIGIVNRSRSKIPRRRLERDCGVAFRFLKKRLEHLESIGVGCVEPRESGALARAYLKKNHPANVLAFDYGIAADIVLTPALIRREARALGDGYEHRLRALLAHGWVHLAGFEHEADHAARGRFERVEKKLIKKLDL